MRNWVLGILVILFPLYSMGSNNPDTLMQLGAAQLDNNLFDQAFHTFREASELYKQKDSLLSFVHARVEMCNALKGAKDNNIGQIPIVLEPVFGLFANNESLENTLVGAESHLMLGRHQRQILGDYENSMISLNKAISIVENLENGESVNVEALSERSQILANQEQFDAALEDMRRVLEISTDIYGKESPEWAAKTNSLAFIYYRQGNYDRAEQCLLEGIEISKQVKAPPMQVARGLSSLSAVQAAKLDVRSVERTADEFMEIALPIIGPNHPAVGNINWDLGLTYINKQLFDKAPIYLKKAIDIYSAAYGPKFQQLPDTYHLLGTAYDYLEKKDSASYYHTLGQNLKKEVTNNDPIRMSESYRFVIEHYLRWNELIKADSLLMVAEKAANSFDEKSLSRSWFYALKSDLLNKKELWDSSAVSSHNVLYTLSTESYRSSLMENPRIDDLFNLVQSAFSAQNKAWALWKKWQEADERSALNQAFCASNLADSIINKMRTYYRNSDSKILLQNNARDHYDTRAEITYALYQETEDPMYLEYFFKTVENSKSLLLMEAVKNNITEFHDLDDSTYTNLMDLKFRLARAESEWLNAKELNDTAAILTSKNNYNTLAAEYEQFHKKLKAQFPNYYWQNKTDPGSIEDVQNSLKGSVAMLMYYFTDSSLFNLCIHKDKIKLAKVATKKHVESILDSLIANGSSIETILNAPQLSIEKFNNWSYKLYTYLQSTMADFTEGNKKLIVIPDRKLAYFPFEALHTKTEVGNSHAYLLFEIDISYAYSAQLYVNQNFRSSQRKSLFGGFAPSYESESEFQDAYVSRYFKDKPVDLPAAREEVTAIHEVMGGEKWTGSEATETLFKKNVGKYGITHLSLHGMINNEEPLYSKLLFNDADTLNDGYLNVHEIYQLPINSHLTVLSACNSAAGKISQGEGVMSLARSFAYAGCPNLIASLWKADDNSTKEIMISFYDHFNQKDKIARSLSDAKIQYLSQQNVLALKHPYFWAPFVAYESQNTMSLAPINIAFVGALIMLLLGLFWMARRRIKRLKVLK